MALPVVPIDIEGIDVEAFWRKVRRGGPQDCWLWTDRRTPAGYGQFYVSGTRRRPSAHRVAYELLVGAIPDEMVIDHLCRNRACVNPAHMEPVSVQVNTARGIGPTATAARARLAGLCSNGHAIAEVGLHKQGRGMTCAECGRDRVRRYKARRAEVGGA